jgi:hypothetical protein
MAPGITVFVDPQNTHRQAKVIDTIRKFIEVYVNSEQMDPVLMKRVYRSTVHRFFTLEDDWIMFDSNSIGKIEPDLVLTFDIDAVVTDEEWNLVLEFLKNIFSGGFIDGDLYDMVQRLLKKPLTFHAVHTERHPDGVLPSEYDFRYLEMNGIIFCELIKPNTDRPYLCVIRNPEEEMKLLPVFTAYYVCSSWGVCSLDAGYLYKLWDLLEYNKYESLDLEQRLKKEVELCSFASGRLAKAEPEVYRMTIEQLWSQWDEKEKGKIVRKRFAEEDLNMEMAKK